MSLSARVGAAAAAFVLFCVVLAGAAACVVIGAVTSPLSSLWHAVTADPARTERRWTADDYVRLIATAEQTAPARAAAVAIGFAASRVGQPYVWGGTGPLGYDCSGLTQAAYEVAGIDLPRVATAQYHEGVKVSLRSLEPGDLVYYGNSAFAHHVAIYLGTLDGQSVVLDAPHTGAVVRLDPLTAGDLFAATRPALATGVAAGVATSMATGVAATR